MHMNKINYGKGCKKWKNGKSYKKGSHIQRAQRSSNISSSDIMELQNRTEAPKHHFPLFECRWPYNLYL
jgi:hypothetical protein